MSRRPIPRQIAEIANGLMDPVLARRAGISTALLGSWDEIAGEEFADCTRPEKIAWPRHGDPGDEGGHRPGVLTIAWNGEQLRLTGPAESVFTGQVDIDKLVFSMALNR